MPPGPVLRLGFLAAALGAALDLVVLLAAPASADEALEAEGLAIAALSVALSFVGLAAGVAGPSTREGPVVEARGGAVAVAEEPELWGPASPLAATPQAAAIPSTAAPSAAPATNVR